MSAMDKSSEESTPAPQSDCGTALASSPTNNSTSAPETAILRKTQNVIASEFDRTYDTTTAGTSTIHKPEEATTYVPSLFDNIPRTHTPGASPFTTTTAVPSHLCNAFGIATSYSSPFCNSFDTSLSTNTKETTTSAQSLFDNTQITKTSATSTFVRGVGTTTLTTQVFDKTFKATTSATSPVGNIFGTTTSSTSSLGNTFGTISLSTSPFGNTCVATTSTTLMLGNTQGATTSAKSPFGNILRKTTSSTSPFGNSTTPSSVPLFRFTLGTTISVNKPLTKALRKPKRSSHTPGKTTESTNKTYQPRKATQERIVPPWGKGSYTKFYPPTGHDTMLRRGVSKEITTKYQCITAMVTYGSKSLEELRLEDYDIPSSSNDNDRFERVLIDHRNFHGFGFRRKTAEQNDINKTAPLSMSAAHANVGKPDDLSEKYLTATSIDKITKLNSQFPHVTPRKLDTENAITLLTSALETFNISPASERCTTSACRNLQEIFKVDSSDDSQGENNFKTLVMSGLSGYKDDSSANLVTKGKQMSLCDVCEVENAILFCENCPGNLCQSCVTNHKVSKLTKHHKYSNIIHVKSSFVTENATKNIYCSDHVILKAIGICKSCNITFCKMCSFNHETDDILHIEKQTTQEMRVLLVENFNAILDTIRILEKCEENEDKDINDLHMSQGDIKKLFVERFDNVIENIKTQKAQTLQLVRELLEIARYIKTKLQPACTSSDQGDLVLAFNLFYRQFRSLNHSVKMELAKSPAFSEFKRQLFSVIELVPKINLIKVKYDRLTIEFTEYFGNMVNVIPLQNAETVCFVDCADEIGLYDLVNSKVKKSSQVGPSRNILILSNTILITKENEYQLFNHDIEAISKGKMPKTFLAYCAWGDDKIVAISHSEPFFNSAEIYMLTVKSNSLDHTIEGQIPQAALALHYRPVLLTKARDSNIIAVTNYPTASMSKFSLNGRHVTNFPLTDALCDEYICSIFVDDTDNLLAGCASGNVYLVDYIRNITKKIVDVSGPVTCIDSREGTLFVFVKFPSSNHGNCQSVLYKYKF